jgi:hypothetical protein
MSHKVMSFNIERGERVLVMPESGSTFNGFFGGVVPDGTGVVNIPGFNAECISAMPPSLNAEEQEEQYREVLKYVVDEAISPDNLSRLGYNLGFPSGEYCLSFPCPTVVMVNVKGRPTMASIPIALRNKSLMFESYLITKVGFCHQNTEISYTWGKDGMLNLFYKWGPK